MPALLGPQVEQITEDEHRCLAAFLHLIRRRESWMSHYADEMKWLGEHLHEFTDPPIRKKCVSLEDAIAAALREALDQSGANRLEGLLLDEADALHELGEGEPAALRQFLSLVQSNSWLREFIGKELEFFEKGHRRTPLQVLAALNDELAEFEEKARIAREMFREHPELFRDLESTRAASAA